MFAIEQAIISDWMRKHRCSVGDMLLIERIDLLERMISIVIRQIYLNDQTRNSSGQTYIFERSIVSSFGSNGLHV